jgi:c-di-GMP-binding flagellar brake protein YcgR
MTVKERRNFDRISIQLDIKYAIINKALSKDLSKGGIRIQTGEKLEKDSELTLIFTLPDEVGRLIKTFGRVVWCREVETTHFEAGLEFWDMEESYVEAMENFVNTRKNNFSGLPA